VEPPTIARLAVAEPLAELIVASPPAEQMPAPAHTLEPAA